MNTPRALFGWAWYATLLGFATLALAQAQPSDQEDESTRTHPRAGVLGHGSGGGKAASSATVPADAAPDPAGHRAWQQANELAEKAVRDFDAALKSGDPQRIRKAALDLQADPIAVQKLNRGSEELIRAHNRVTEEIKAQTRQKIRENMARDWNARNPDNPITPDDVEIYEPTNVRGGTERPRAGQDWDVTVRVKGKDVPPSQSRRVVNESYFEAAGGEQTFGKGSTPDSAAHKQSIETTSGKSAEAYTDPEKLGVGGRPADPKSKLSDPEQVSKTIEYKSQDAANKAAEARGAGDEVGAVRQEFEQARQAVKQYDRITKPRVEAAGGSVHGKVEEGMNVLRDVAEGRISPAEGRARLQQMGETPESIISKASSQVEAAQKLKPGSAEGAEGSGRVSADSPEAKGRTRPDAPEGAGRVSADEAGGAGKGAGKAGKALEVVGKGLQVVDIGSTLQDAKESLRDGDVGKMREAAINTVDNFTGGAIGTGRMLKDRLGDAREEKNQAQQEARDAAKAEWEQQMRVELRKAGYSREQADQMVEAASRGDLSAVRDAYSQMGKEVPKIRQTDPTVGESLKNYGAEVVENTKEVAKGLGEKAGKTGRFVKEAVEDTFEIGTGLTEKGVAKELLQQQKERLTLDNFKAGLEHAADIGAQVAGLKATDQEREKEAVDRLAQKLIERGVSPKDAEALARDRIFNPTDSQTRQAIQDALAKADGRSGKSDRSGESGTADRGKDSKKPTADVKPTQGTKDSRTSSPAGVRTPDPVRNEPIAATPDARASSDSLPRNDAGEAVDPDRYRPGDMIITKDGTEYVQKDGKWEASGRHYGEYKPTDLKGAEAGDDSSKNWKWSGGSSPNVMEQFTGERSETRKTQVASAGDLMGSHQQVVSATTSGDSSARDAARTREVAGLEAQQTRDKAARDAAQKARDQSWGKEIGDAVTAGIQKGGEAFGEALGSAAAQKAASTIFGESKPQGGTGTIGGTDGGAGTTGGTSGKGGTTATTGKKVAPPATGASSVGSPPKTAGGDPADTGGSPPGGAGTAGADATGQGPDAGQGGGSVTVTGTASAGDAASAGGPPGGATDAGSSGSGGYAAGPQDRTIDGSGALAGRTVTGVTVQLDYDARIIPDSFSIIYEGKTLASSGMVSGTGTLTGKGAGSTPQVIIRVMSNQNDQSTVWSWNARVTFHTSN